MTSNLLDTVRSLAAIQAELRRIPQRGNVFGCRLLHWNPELEHVTVDVVFDGESESLNVYTSHLDDRVGGHPHVFFHKLHKTKYGEPGGSGSAERRFGITYSTIRYPKSEVKPLLESLTQSAARAGALVANVPEQLAGRLSAATLAAKQDLHRWIFTVYDIAWGKPSGSRLKATRYIPVQGLDESMRTDESVIYDLARIRSTPWSKVERRLDPNGWGDFVHLKEPYASWSVELPQYYASRIDDIVQASDWAIDFLVKELATR
jgi:hypothetical protein